MSIHSPHSAATRELLTVRQAAELLNVSSRLIWLLTKQGALTPVRIRRCTRWRRADLLAYLDRLTAARAEREVRCE